MLLVGTNVSRYENNDLILDIDIENNADDLGDHILIGEELPDNINVYDLFDSDEED